MKYNGAALCPIIPRNIVDCNKKFKNCLWKYCQKHLYVDDLGEAEAINLKQQLVVDPVNRPFPLTRHERTGHIYPKENSLL